MKNRAKIDLSGMIALLLVLGFGLAACSSFTCAGQSEEFMEEALVLAEQWTDASNLAASTPRTS